MPGVLVIDNYDSFTYNLVQYLGEIGARISVYRNDQITVEEAKRLDPECVVISPGPGRPESSGVCLELIKAFAVENVPILGVCLGHQAIAVAFGAEVGQARRVVHGKASQISHAGGRLYHEVPSPFLAGRYHSLEVKQETLPECLEVTAWADDGTLMGLRHRTYPVEGVQFHPESILTQHGRRIVKNFLVNYPFSRKVHLA